MIQRGIRRVYGVWWYIDLSETSCRLSTLTSWYVAICFAWILTALKKPAKKATATHWHQWTKPNICKNWADILIMEMNIFMRLNNSSLVARCTISESGLTFFCLVFGFSSLLCDASGLIAFWCQDTPINGLHVLEISWNAYVSKTTQCDTRNTPCTSNPFVLQNVPFRH